MALRGGRYERIRGIATGGMATVYLGRAHGHGVGGFQRPVAIKVMHDHLAKMPEFVSMFMDEARMAAGIRHPNVVATLDAVRDDQGLFLVLEYVEGLSIQHITKGSRQEGEVVPYDITVRLIMDALLGLHAAHEHKDEEGELLQLVHRDVSPANILVGLDGIARITDFGIARAESRAHVTRTGEIKGKIAYMSVEQIRSSKVDRRSDVYSAALILWELLARRRCLKADSDGATALLAAEGVKLSPREVNPEVPEQLSDCCMKALVVEREQRYQTAAEFAEALEDAAHDAGIRPAKPREVGAYAKRMITVCGMENLVTGSAPGKAAAQALPAARDAQETKPDLEPGASSTEIMPGPGSDPTPPPAAPIPTGPTESVSVLTPIPNLRGGGSRRNVIIGTVAGAAALLILVVALSGGEDVAVDDASGVEATPASDPMDEQPGDTSANAGSDTGASAAEATGEPSPTSAPTASAVDPTKVEPPVEVATEKKPPQSTASPPPWAPPQQPPPKAGKKPNWGY